LYIDNDFFSLFYIVIIRYLSAPVLCSQRLKSSNRLSLLIDLECSWKEKERYCTTYNQLTFIKEKKTLWMMKTRFEQCRYAVLLL